MSSFVMEWSREMNLKLIAELKKRKSLWDRHSVEYHDKNKRKEDYQDLAIIFLSPTSEVKKKIHNLKSQFRREYKKSKANTNTPYKSQWYGFTLLKFLKEFDEGKTSKDKKNSKKRNLEKDLSSIPASSIKISEALEKQLEEREKFVNTKDLFCSKQMTETTDKQIRDEYTVFGEYVTHELRKLENPYVTAITKHKIQESLFEAQMSVFSSMCDYKENNASFSQNFDECASTSSCASNIPSSTTFEQSGLNS